ncbi:MAG: hypothetical protein ACI9JE_001623, partial [Candidatus Krumholzibacteriia bacterium]
MKLAAIVIMLSAQFLVSSAFAQSTPADSLATGNASSVEEAVAPTPSAPREKAWHPGNYWG